METIERLLYLLMGIILGVILVSPPPEPKPFPESIAGTIDALNLPLETLTTLKEISEGSRPNPQPVVPEYWQQYAIEIPFSNETQAAIERERYNNEYRGRK
jgi:hypothetical protein